MFGVPLARGFRRIHTNVNMSYYNYSKDEINFSREIIRYWSNFIKTGFVQSFSLFFSSPRSFFRNPNGDSSSIEQWKPYTADEHNYLFFQLNHIHTERNYFDSMYEFWLTIFRTETRGGCIHRLILVKMRQHLKIFLIVLLILLGIVSIALLRKYCRKKAQNRTRNHFNQYPKDLTTTST